MRAIFLTAFLLVVSFCVHLKENHQRATAGSQGHLGYKHRYCNWYDLNNQTNSEFQFKCQLFLVTLQPSGTLYIVDTEDGGKTMWSTNVNQSKLMQKKSTIPGGGNKIRLQPDGNLVIFDKNRQVTWSSDSKGRGEPPYLISMKNGQLNINDRREKLIWSSQPSDELQTGGQIAQVYTSSYFDFLNTKNPCPKCGNTLLANQYLGQGGLIRYDIIIARMQKDGNFALYYEIQTQNYSLQLQWSTNISKIGTGKYRMRMRPDGDAVIQDQNLKAMWSSNSKGKGVPPYRMFLKFALYIVDGNGQIIWSNPHRDEFLARGATQLITGNWGTFSPCLKCGNTLKEHQYLGQGGLIRSGEYFARMGSNGKFVIYQDIYQDILKNIKNYVLWSTQVLSQGIGPYRITLRKDGNAIISDRDFEWIWSSKSGGNGQPPYRMTLEKNTLRILDGKDTIIWSTDQAETFQQLGKRIQVFTGNWGTFRPCPTCGDTLQAYQYLGDGGLIRSGEFYARMETNGNYVIYQDILNGVNNHAWWSTKTSKIGTGPYMMIMMNYGNAVIQDKNKALIWSSNSRGRGIPPYRMDLENSILRIKDGKDRIIWSTDPSDTIQTSGQLAQVYTGTGTWGLFPKPLPKCGNTLQANQYLGENGLIRSGNFYLQLNFGNICIYSDDPINRKRDKLWQSKSYNSFSKPTRLIMQPDGNAVVYGKDVYGKDGLIIWSSNSTRRGVPPYRMVIETKTLRIRDGKDRIIWSTDQSETIQTSGQLAQVYTQKAGPWQPPKPCPQCGAGILSNQYLGSGGLIRYLDAYAIMQTYGNFAIVRDGDDQIYWSTQTTNKGTGPYKLLMHPYGNVMIQDKNGLITWNSGTQWKGKPPYVLVLIDRNLSIIDSGGRTIWSTKQVNAFNQNVCDQISKGPWDMQKPKPCPLCGNTLRSGQCLSQGSLLRSGQVFGVMSADGRFIVYKDIPNSNGEYKRDIAFTQNPIRQSGLAPYKMIMHPNGEVVIISARERRVIWSSAEALSRPDEDTYPPFKMVLNATSLVISEDRTNGQKQKIRQTLSFPFR